MGLDITVNVTAEEVREGLEDSDCGVKHPEVARKLLERFADDEKIHVRPGSYSGLHVVRDQFIRLKKLDPEPTTAAINAAMPESHLEYHLLNHCDAEGWYLPDDFSTPAWADGVSIGSSVRLLAELEELEIERGKQPDDGWGSRWDAVYIAAVASVVTNTPIHFG